MSNLVTRIKQFRPATPDRHAGPLRRHRRHRNHCGFRPDQRQEDQEQHGHRQKKLKNRTITKNKLAPATVKAPQGAAGPEGRYQPARQGRRRQPDHRGVRQHQHHRRKRTRDRTVSVPAGKYMVTAWRNTFALGSGRTECFVTTNSGGGGSEPRAGTRLPRTSATPLPVVYVTDTGLRSPRSPLAAASMTPTARSAVR